MNSLAVQSYFGGAKDAIKPVAYVNDKPKRQTSIAYNCEHGDTPQSKQTVPVPPIVQFHLNQIAQSFIILWFSWLWPSESAPLNSLWIIASQPVSTWNIILIFFLQVIPVTSIMRPCMSALRVKASLIIMVMSLRRSAPSTNCQQCKNQ